MQLPSFVKDSCLFFVFSAQRWFNVCDHWAGGRTPSRVVLPPKSWTEHKKRAVGLVGFGNPIWAPHEWVGKGVTPSSLLGCQAGFVWAVLSREVFCAGFENSRSLQCGHCLRAAGEGILSESSWIAKKLHHVTISYITLHTENVP